MTCTPDLFTAELKATLAFYTDTLGFTVNKVHQLVLRKATDEPATCADYPNRLAVPSSRHWWAQLQLAERESIGRDGATLVSEPSGHP